MFNYEVYEKLLNNPEEAKAYCESLPNDLVAQSELIILDIIFFHQHRFLENYVKLQKYLNVFKRTGNKRGYIRIISNLTFYSIDLNLFLDTKKYAEITIKYLPDYEEAKVALAFANLKLGKDIESSFEFLKTQSNNNELSSEMKNICFSGISEYYARKSLFEEGYKFFEKSFIYSNEIKILRREMLNMALGNIINYENVMNCYDAYIETCDEEEIISLTFFIADKLLTNKFFDETKVFIEKLSEFKLNEEDMDALHILKARHYGMQKDYDNALKELNLISENTQKSNPYVSYLYATTIFLNDDRRKFKEGVEYLQKTYDLYPNDENYSNLINGYLISEDYEEAEKLMKSGKINKKNPIYLYYNGVIHMKKGDWNKAERELFNYMVKIKTRIPEYVYAAKTNTPIKKAIFKDYANGNTLNDIRHQANMYLHGFGEYKTPNIEKSIKLLEEKLDSKSFDNCCISLLGNAYLKNKENKKAFDLFEKGHKRYIEYKDNCTCATGFYCYCLSNGIGTIKNEEESFNILDSLDPKTMSNICVFTYVDLCIKYNKNLEKAWTMLENLHEWRYNAGKYFMMIKLAPYVNKKIKKYKKMLNKCLKHLPVLEKIHYLEEQNTFYLTNI